MRVLFNTNTRPFAVRAPRSSLGTPPMTLFMATESEVGWKKFIDSVTPVEKVCQFMSSRRVFCWMFVAVASCVISPLPPVMTPPVGAASTVPATLATSIAPITRNLAHLNMKPFLPFLCFHLQSLSFINHFTVRFSRDDILSLLGATVYAYFILYGLSHSP